MAAEAPEIDLEIGHGDVAAGRLRGALVFATVPAVQGALLELARGSDGEVELDLSAVERMDSAGAALIFAVLQEARGRGRPVRLRAASDAARATLGAFGWVDEGAAASRRPPLLERLGQRAVDGWAAFVEWLQLTADTVILSFGGAPRTRRVRRGAWITEALRIGVEALPIVGLIAFLIGVVVALQSAYQLRQFGAQIYVANLIALSMTREMGPLMTAILLAGRSGAAIAAEVATMKVSEEVDALETLGLDPVRYVVVPKFQGITLTMPFLVVYANLLGILGGFLVALLYLDLSATAFFSQVIESMMLKDILTGLLKSLAFAWIIVLIAAFFGFRARGGSESVGRVTTASVVASIFWVIVADAAFSLIFYFGD